MEWPTGVRRLLRLQRRDRASIGASVDEEIAFHIDMRARELQSRGMDGASARGQAEREFGDIAATRAELIASDAWTHRRRSWWQASADLLREVRIAGRTLWRAPFFTAVAVGTLALGIGANTALFSVVYGVVLKPLPYAEPERLVAVAPEHSFMRAEYAMLRERARSYAGVAAVQPGAGVAVTLGGEAVRLVAAYTSANLLDVLGVQPLVGRGFAVEEELSGAEPVVLLSYALALELFGDAAAALTRTVLIDGGVRTVVGVLPPRFSFPSAATRLWLPLTLDATQPATYWGIGGTQAIGRLAADVTPDAARRELIALAADMRLANPFWTPHEPYRAENTVEPLAERLTASARRPLLLLLGATGFVLLIACANVGNLCLVRVIGRQRDLAVRHALGGGTRHVIRTVALESGVLAAVGGAFGIVLGVVFLRVLLPLLPPDTPRLEEVALDARVLLFALFATTVAALLFTAVPALRVSGRRLHELLRSGARTAGTERGARRVAGAVVAAEVALSVVLLVGAALLVRSMQQLHAIDPGFRTDGIVAARIAPPDRLLPDGDARLAFHTRVTTELAMLPGVTGVALTGQLPFDGELSLTAAAIEHVTTDPNELPVFDFLPVTPDYFGVLGIALREGRLFDATDRAGSLPVAIIDRATADRFFPGGGAIGGRIGRPWMREWLSIVGVVESVRNHDLAGDATPAFYVPFAQQPAAAATLVVRSDQPHAVLAAAVRDAVRAAHPGVPVSDVRPLEALVRGSVADARSITLLLSAFAGMALLLGALGIYGVLAYSVQQRSGELGVRLALGATAAQVRGHVLRAGARLVAAGLLVGVPLALLLARSLQGLLFGIAPTDAASLAAAFAVLAVVGLLAALIPAARAARLDPASTLRDD